MKIKKIGTETLWRVLTAVFALVLTLAVAGDVVTKDWSGYINKMLGVSGTKIVNKEGDEQDPLHYKSDFDTYTDVMNNARAVAKEVQAEGSVLMTNKDGALPLAKGSNVTFFSYSVIDPAYGGTGSGGVSATKDRLYDFEKACAENGKLNANPTVFEFYHKKFDEEYKVTPERPNMFGGGVIPATITRSSEGGFVVPEVPASLFGNTEKNSFDSYKDAAIFVLSRIGGEGSDLIKTSAAEGLTKYLQLTDDEKSVLQMMKDGPFSKRIVLVNTFNAPELGWLDEYDIDACLYIGGPGEVGLSAVTDILVGNINPSGKLADTYAYDSFSSPAMQNFGDFTFLNADQVANPDSKKYLVYSEGIYVGYRYYETRYEDCVLNRGGAAGSEGTFASEGNWKYSEEVQFPFGYGLSYSKFTQSLGKVSVDEKNKKVSVPVTVKNELGAAGKDVIEVYAQAPYTPGGIEKSAVQLVGFAKTDVIEPGKTYTTTVEIDLNDLASYDYETEKTYVLDSGDYYFAIGNGAHEALNNILAAKGATGMDAEGDASKAYKWTKKDFDNQEYMLSKTKKKVTNRFEETDLNYYSENGSDLVTYLSRNDWSGTWPKNMTGFAATARMLSDMASLYDAGGGGNPSAYVKGETDISSVTMGSKETAHSIAMMIGVDYDDPAWEQLLNQITLKEMAAFSKQGRTEVLSVYMPDTTAVDGPAAWTKSTYKENYADYSENAKKTDVAMVLYPTETVVAGTWNVKLVEKLGNSFGEEGLWGGGVGWYGPAANIHRTPYAGRNFEYYSEDGFISGKLAESECKGAMNRGVIPYLKHFFLNDQETNRIGVCTFSNEQAMREVYLRAFQYAFETTGDDDKSCTGVMGAFNRLGVTWTGHHSDLWKEVMEGEWGFKGNITTDFGQKEQTLMEPQLAYEAGTTMFCTSNPRFENIIAERAKTDLKLLTNLREATKRNLYNFANSLAMNGMTSSSKVVPIMTWYNIALLTIIIVSAVALAGSAAMLGLHAFGKKEEEKNGND